MQSVITHFRKEDLTDPYQQGMLPPQGECQNLQGLTPPPPTQVVAVPSRCDRKRQYNKRLKKRKALQWRMLFGFVASLEPQKFTKHTHGTTVGIYKVASFNQESHSNDNVLCEPQGRKTDEDYTPLRRYHTGVRETFQQFVKRTKFSTTRGELVAGSSNVKLQDIVQRFDLKHTISPAILDKLEIPFTLVDIEKVDNGTRMDLPEWIRDLFTLQIARTGYRSIYLTQELASRPEEEWEDVYEHFFCRVWKDGNGVPLVTTLRRILQQKDVPIEVRNIGFTKLAPMPTILQTVLNTLRYLHFDIECLYDVMKFVETACVAIATDARYFINRAQYTRKEYKRQYNDAFGRIIHTPAMQNLEEQIYEDTEMNEDDSLREYLLQKFKTEIVGKAAAAVTARRVGKEIYAQRKCGRSQNRQHARDAKMLSLQWEPQGYFQEKFSDFMKRATEWLKTTMSSLGAGIMEVVKANWLVWQSRIVALLALAYYVGTGQKDGIAIQIAHLVASSVDFSNAPQWYTRLCDLVSGVAPAEDANPTCWVGDTSGWQEIFGFKVPRHGEYLAEVERKRRWLYSDGREKATATYKVPPPVDERSEENVFREVFEIQEGDMYDPSIYAACQLWFCRNMVPATEPQDGETEWWKDTCFTRFVVHVFDCAKEVPDSALHFITQHAKTIAALNGTISLASKVIAWLQALISSICLYLFQMDPFDPARTKMEQVAQAMHLWSETTHNFTIEKPAKFLEKYCLMVSWLADPKNTKLSNHTYQRIVKDVERLREVASVARTLQSLHRRTPPLTIMFYGASETGKSSAMKTLAMAFLEAVNGTPFTDAQWAFHRKSQYMETYRETTEVLCFDEWCTFKDPEAIAEDVKNLITFSNSVPTLVEKAFQGADGKGNLYANLKGLFITTNLTSPAKSFFPVQDPQAVANRIDLFVQVLDKTDIAEQRFVVGGRDVDNFVIWYMTQGKRGSFKKFETKPPQWGEFNFGNMTTMNGGELVVCMLWTYEKRISRDKQTLMVPEDLTTFVKNTIADHADLVTSLRQRVKDNVPEYEYLNSVPTKEAQRLFPQAQVHRLQPEVEPQGPQLFVPNCSYETVFEKHMVQYPSFTDVLCEKVKERPWTTAVIGFCVVALPLLTGLALLWRSKKVDSEEQSYQQNTARHGHIPNPAGVPGMRRGKPTKAANPNVEHQGPGIAALEAAVDADLASRFHVDIIFTDKSCTDTYGVFVAPYVAMIAAHSVAYGKVSHVRFCTQHDKNKVTIPRYCYIDADNDLAFLILPTSFNPRKTIMKRLVTSSYQAMKNATMQFVGINENVTIARITRANIHSLAPCAYKVAGGDTFQTEECLWYYIESARGMCGNLLYTEQNGNWKVCGMHTSGTTDHRQGGACFITEAKLAALISEAYEAAGIDENLQIVLSIGPVEQHEAQSPVLNQLIPVHNEEEFGHDKKFMVPDKLKPYKQRSSGYSTSPFHGVFGDVPYAPVNMRFYTDEHGERVDPLIAARAKLDAPPYDFQEFQNDDVPFFDLVSDVFYYNLPPQENPYVLTLDEACSGHTDTETPSLALNTSVGFPLNVGGPTTKEHFMVRHGALLEMGPALKNMVDIREELLEKGERALTIFVLSYKDELRKLAKVNTPRAFCASPSDYVIVGRRYFVSMVFAAKQQCLEGPISIGVNPHSADWAFMYTHLTSHNQSGTDGDFKNFDASIPRKLAVAACRIILGWHLDKHNRKRAALLMELVEAYVLWENSVFTLSGGNPSGQFMTAFWNAVIAFICLLSGVAVLAHKYKIPLVYELIKMALYGDDNIVVLPIENFPWSEMVPVIKHHFGMDLTPGTKIGDYVQRRVIDMSYLSRKFVWRSARMHAPLDIQRIYAALYFARDGMRQSLVSTIHNVMLELTHYGKEEYERHRVVLLRHPATADLELSKEIWPYGLALSKRNGEHFWPFVEEQQGLCLSEKDIGLLEPQSGPLKITSDLFQTPLSVGPSPISNNVATGHVERVDAVSGSTTRTLRHAGGQVNNSPALDNYQLIGQFTFTSATAPDTSLFNFEMPSKLLEQDGIARFLQGYMHYNFDSISIMMRTCVPPSQTMVAMLACSAGNQGPGANVGVRGAMQQRMQLLTGQDTGEVVLELPWFYQTNLDMIHTPDLQYDCDCSLLNSLTSISNDPTQTIGVSIFAKFNGLRVYNPCLKELQMTTFEPQSGRHYAQDQPEARAAGSTPGSLQSAPQTTLPGVQEAISMVQEVSSAVADVAGLTVATMALGLDKPTIDPLPAQFTPTVGADFGPKKGDYGLQLTIEPTAHVDTSPTQLGANVDEMALSHLAGLPSYIYRARMVSGARFLIPVNPTFSGFNVMTSNTPLGQTAYMAPNYAGFVALHGTHYHGSMNFLILFNASVLANAVVGIRYHPHADPNDVAAIASGTYASDLQTMHVAIKGSTWVKFCVGWNRETPYDESRLVSYTDAVYHFGGSTPYGGNGVLEFYFVQAPTGPDTTTYEGIGVNIWSSMASDFKLINPRSLVSNNGPGARHFTSPTDWEDCEPQTNIRKEFVDFPMFHPAHAGIKEQGIFFDGDSVDSVRDFVHGYRKCIHFVATGNASAGASTIIAPTPTVREVTNAGYLISEVNDPTLTMTFSVGTSALVTEPVCHIHDWMRVFAFHRGSFRIKQITQNGTWTSFQTTVTRQCDMWDPSVAPAITSGVVAAYGDARVNPVFGYSFPHGRDYKYTSVLEKPGYATTHQFLWRLPDTLTALLEFWVAAGDDFTFGMVRPPAYMYLDSAAQPFGPFTVDYGVPTSRRKRARKPKRTVLAQPQGNDVSRSKEATMYDLHIAHKAPIASDEEVDPQADLCQQLPRQHAAKKLAQRVAWLQGTTSDGLPPKWIMRMIEQNLITEANFPIIAEYNMSAEQRTQWKALRAIGVGDFMSITLAARNFNEVPTHHQVAHACHHNGGSRYINTTNMRQFTKATLWAIATSTLIVPPVFLPGWIVFALRVLVARHWIARAANAHGNEECVRQLEVSYDKLVVLMRAQEATLRDARLMLNEHQNYIQDKEWQPEMRVSSHEPQATTPTAFFVEAALKRMVTQSSDEGLEPIQQLQHGGERKSRRRNRNNTDLMHQWRLDEIAQQPLPPVDPTPGRRIVLSSTPEEEELDFTLQTEQSTTLDEARYNETFANAADWEDSRYYDAISNLAD